MNSDSHILENFQTSISDLSDDLDKMIEFESIYFDWLKERISLEPRQPDLDDKSITVLNFLKQQT